MNGGYLTGKSNKSSKISKSSKTENKKSNKNRILSKRKMFKSEGAHRTYRLLVRNKSRRAAAFLRKFGKKTTHKRRSILV